MTHSYLDDGPLQMTAQDESTALFTNVSTCNPHPLNTNVATNFHTCSAHMKVNNTHCWTSGVKTCYVALVYEMN